MQRIYNQVSIVFSSVFISVLQSENQLFAFAKLFDIAHKKKKVKSQSYQQSNFVDFKVKFRHIILATDSWFS